jgi:sugar (pentulose or hexulose) kinase
MFDRVIAGGETWCFQYDPETKHRACSGKHRIQLARKITHVSVAGQNHACVFIDHKGIVHYEFIAQGQAVNQQCYLEVLRRLRECVRRKDPDSGLISGFSTTTMPLRMMR